MTVDASLVLLEQVFALDTIDHRLPKVFVPHHVCNLIFRVSWSAVSRDFKGLGDVAGWVTPINIGKANVLTLLANGDLEMVLGELFQVHVAFSVVHFDSHVLKGPLHVFFLDCHAFITIGRASFDETIMVEQTVLVFLVWVNAPPPLLRQQRELFVADLSRPIRVHVAIQLLNVLEADL